ncbi:MAG: hypothetical protein ACI3U8_08960, partial [Candidatus Onthomonas sp.]
MTVYYISIRGGLQCGNGQFFGLLGAWDADLVPGGESLADFCVSSVRWPASGGVTFPFSELSSQVQHPMEENFKR